MFLRGRPFGLGFRCFRSSLGGLGSLALGGCRVCFLNFFDPFGGATLRADPLQKMVLGNNCIC